MEKQPMTEEEAIKLLAAAESVLRMADPDDPRTQLDPYLQMKAEATAVLGPANPRLKMTT